MLLATLTFALASANFTPYGPIPDRNTCAPVRTGNGPRDVSPELHWLGAPDGTQSYALVMQDRDYRGGYVHWIVYDIPADTQSYQEGQMIPAPAVVGMGMFGRQYAGPCPPWGQTHHYVFTLYALDTAALKPHYPLNAMGLMRAMRGHILNRAYLVGVYTQHR